MNGFGHLNIVTIKRSTKMQQIIICDFSVTEAPPVVQVTISSDEVVEGKKFKGKK